jgi:hypothetical protein
MKDFLKLIQVRGIGDGPLFRLLNKTSRKKILLGITMSILLLMLCVVPASAESSGIQAEVADFTEGGHLETDFDAFFMAEWWYLNGNATLVASDGEKKDVGFFVVLQHQESPMFIGLSRMVSFYGLYFDDNTTAYDRVRTFVPREDVNQYIALHTPYVYYRYPDGLKELYGSALTGYNLKYVSEDTNMDLLFQTNVEKTIDQADHPLNFITYERSYGTLHGSILLDGKRYNVTHGEGYLDHMIPIGSGSWLMDMHGWIWFEVTTKDYQAVGYAIRGMDDGYDDYSYKHLTLLNKHTGKVLAEYSGDEIMIIETDWINEAVLRKRPATVLFSTPNLNVTVNAENVINFQGFNPIIGNAGFVDFMAFQPDNATIQYNGDIEEGSAFYEYSITGRVYAFVDMLRRFLQKLGANLVVLRFRYFLWG